MPSKRHKSNTYNDNTKVKMMKQTNIFGAVTMMARELLLVGKEVLLTDEIYGNCVPIDMRGLLFCYLVTAYDVESKVFPLQYANKMITANGARWIHQDGNRENMANVAVETVKAGSKLYNAACTRINDFKWAQVDAAKASLRTKVQQIANNDEIDYSDLDEAARLSDNGWMGQEVIEVDFE